MQKYQEHIVHLTSVHPAFDTRIFLKECRALVEAGFKVTLIAPHHRNEMIDGVRIIAVSQRGSRLARMVAGTYRVFKIARKLTAGVYHFHDPELMPVGLALRMMGRRVVYDIHEDLPRALFAGSRDYIPGWLKIPASKLLEWFENIAVRGFSSLIAATPAIGRRFSAMNSKTVVVNNYPILGELAGFKKQPWHCRAHAVAYVGSISLERGLHQMIEAMTLLECDPQVRLKLAGDFSLPKENNDITISPGWGRTDILGYLDRGAVAELLSNVYAGLVLFHPEPNHIQAQPNKLFEYMSAGIPVIASDFPLWRNIIGRFNCGILVDPLDPKKIAESINFLITHPEEAAAMGNRGRIAVEEKYNWGVEKYKLLKVYSEAFECE